MSAPSLILRVSAIRSHNPLGRGGAIFTGVEIDVTGQRVDAKAHVVVKAPHYLIQCNVESGQLWRITGVAENNAIVVNGYRLVESTIVPEAMELLRPSGEHIVTLLAECDAFKGIGMVKARRLWDAFGEDLYAILDAVAVAESGVAQGHLGVDPVATGQVDDREQQIADLFVTRVIIGCSRDLGEFFGDLVARSVGVGPVKTDTRRAALQFLRAEQRRQ